MSRSTKDSREPKGRPRGMRKGRIPPPNRQGIGMTPANIRGGVMRPPNVHMVGRPAPNLQAGVMLPPVAQVAGIPPPNVQGWRIPPPNAPVVGVPPNVQGGGMMLPNMLVIRMPQPNLQVRGMPPIPEVMGVPPGIDPDSPPREDLTPIPVPNWLLYRPRRVGEHGWAKDNIKSFLVTNKHSKLFPLSAVLFYFSFIFFLFFYVHFLQSEYHLRRLEYLQYIPEFDQEWGSVQIAKRFFT